MILREFLKQIDLNFNKITSQINNKSITFINNFVNYFPSAPSKLLKDNMTAKFDSDQRDNPKANDDGIEEVEVEEEPVTQETKVEEEPEPVVEEPVTEEPVTQETNPVVTEETNPVVTPETNPVTEETNPVVTEEQVTQEINPVTEEQVTQETNPVTEETNADTNNNLVGGANKQHFTSNLEKKSNISYYIVITLELFPGKEIPIQQKVNMGCQVTHNKLQKAWAEFLGKKYALPPKYREPTKTSSKQTVKNKPTNNNRTTRRHR